MVGIHLSTLCTDSWTEPLAQHIKKAGEIGYDGVEFPLMNPKNFPIKEYQSILEECGLKCTCGTGLNPTTDIGSPEQSIREAGIAHLKRCIDISAQLGSPILGGVILSAWGYCSNETKSTEWQKRVADSLTSVLDHAKNNDVRLACELLNRYEGSFINNVSDALHFDKFVNHESLGYHYDSFHAHIEERNHKNSIIQLQENLYHFHVCGSDRGIPQNDSIDWDLVVDGLKVINYDQWLVVEMFSQGGSDLGRDVNIWGKSPLSTVEVAQKAYEFTRELEKKIRG